MPDTPPRAPQLASRFGPAPAFTQPLPLSGLAYDAAVLADRPVLYVTGTAADVSGHGHTVSAVGSPTTAAVLPNGDPGWSLDASGTQYLQVADADDLSVVTTGTLTVECWVAPSAVNQPNAKNTQYVNFLSKAGFQPVPGSNQNEWELRYFSANTTDPGNSGESYCGYASTSLGATSFTGNDDTVGVTPGQWAHLAVVYTATTVTIYRDGRQVNTATFSGVPQNGTAPVTIGAGQISESDASFWYGAIGKVAVYSTALSAARITAHYMAMGLQVSVPVLVNTAEGGSGGVTVTNNNSGGLSGHAWDSVTIGTGATVVFDKTHTVHGRFSVNLAQPSGVASSAFLQWGSSAIGAQRTVWFRFYLYLTAYPTANVRVFTGVQTASLCGALLLLTTGQLLATDSLGGTSFTFTGSVPLNRNVRVEGFLTGDAATGQWEVRQFNTADSLTADEVRTSAANQNTTGPLNIYRFGFASTTTQTPAFTSWWDDLGLSAAGYLGPSPVGQFLVPVPYPVPNTPWMSPLASQFGPAQPFTQPPPVPAPPAAVATVRSSSTYASAATEASFSVPLPAGFAAGDVCYLFAEGRAASGAFGAAPSGWTAVAASFPSGASTSSFMVCYRKVMAGGEGNPTVTGTSGRYSAVCVAVQGADNTTPEDVAVVTDNGGASALTTITSPGVTPAGANDLLLTGFGCGTPASGTAINYTTPAGMSLVAAVSTTVAAVTESGMMVASQALTSSAATGTDQTTITPSAIDGQTVTIGVRTAGTGGAANITGVAAAVTVAAPAGAVEGDQNLTGVAAPITVASPAGTPAGSGNTPGVAAAVTVAGGAGVAAAGGAVNVTGTAAPVTVASPAGTPATAANITGVAAPVTVAAPAGAAAGAAPVTGAAAPVTVAAPAGAVTAAANITGVAASVTVASPAGVASSAVNITGVAAPVTVAAPAGTPFGSSPNASISGVAAAVTAAAAGGVPHAGAALTGASAPVTVAGGQGTASAPGAVTGVAAHITAAAPAGALAGGAGITGTAAPVFTAAPAGVLAAAANTAGLAALVTVLGGHGTTFGGGATIPAGSTPTVSATGTSTATVTDPRDGTATVTAPGTSAPSVS